MAARETLISLKRIEDAIEDRKELIAQGLIKDYPEYRQNSGFIEGLRLALAIINDTAKDIAEGNL